MFRTANQPSKLRLFCVATVPDTHWYFLCGQLGYLQSNGFDVTLVASPGQKLKDCEQRDGVRCVQIPIARKIQPISDLVSFSRLWYLLWCEKPDIVQYSTPKAALLCSVAAALAGIRCRIFLARGSIATANRGSPLSFNAWAEWLTARLSHEVICVSPSLRRFLREQRVLGETEGIVIENGMSNGIDYEKFAVSGNEQHGLNQNNTHQTIGFVGRLNSEKGINDLAAVWAKIRGDFPSCRLLLVGGWDSEAAVTRKTRQMFEADPRVEITGELADIRPALCRINVLCFPSHREGFPNAPMEAAAAGIPVVAYDTVGTSDAVVSERTGKLVAIRDTDGLAAALREYLKDPVLAMSHGKAGQMRVRACFQQLPIWRGLARCYRDAARRAAAAQGWYRKLGKPSFDRFFAALALIALSPLLGALWAIVRLRLGSPAIFTQRRPGLRAKPFLLYKFRTMTADRDDRGDLLPDANRLTPFGRWLRSTSLDELPELWNILRGEMSFVGPRPLLMEYLPRYQGKQGNRHDVKPGLTGLAQVMGRNQLSWQRKFRFDNFYIEKLSLGLDISILCQTLRTVVRRAGVVDDTGVTASLFRPDNEFIIFGADGYANEVVSILESLGHRVIGLYDQNELLQGKVIHGSQVLGDLDGFIQACHQGQRAVIAIEDNVARQNIVEKLSGLARCWETVVHPSAVVDSTAVLGQGTVVCAGAIIQAGAKIGSYAIINRGAKIDHDCRVADYAHVTAGVTLAGQCHVGRAAVICKSGAGRGGRHTGEGSAVGVGAFSVRDVEPQAAVVGCPAMLHSITHEAGSVADGSWPYFDAEQISAVTRVMQSGKVNYWTGSECRSFEKEFAEHIGVNHAIAVANGTVALELALTALNIGPGDEVIVPSRTFIATASAVVMRNATPRLADIDLQSQNITAESIRKAITGKTRAIIVVHLGGWPCEMNEILALAKSHNLFVIEDCAQAHGAKYRGRNVGSFGHVAAFSFCQDKIMTTAGEGGMVVTNDYEIAKKAWSFKDHGKDWDLVNAPSDGTYRFLHTSFGTNLRMTEVQAAVGRIQLKKLNTWHQMRTTNAAILSDGLSNCFGLEVPLPASHCEHAFYRVYANIRPGQLRCGWNRDEILRHLLSRGVQVGVGSCAEIYRETAFQKLDCCETLQNASYAQKTSLAFLVHPGISESHLRDTVQITREIMAAATTFPRTQTTAAA